MSNANEPAFPVPNEANVNNQTGLTKLECFAMRAMQGELASQSTGDIFTEAGAADMARRSVIFAKALIVELEKQP